VSIHDETPTSELPAITGEITYPVTPARTRRPWYRIGRRATLVALAGVVSVSLAGVALATGGSNLPAHTVSSNAADRLPTLLAPSRSAAPRANRGTRPTPTGTQPASAPSWVTPMASFRVTSCYGMRRGRPHQGIDLADHPGAKILAAHAGTVVAAGWNSGGYGNMVIIKHNQHLFTLYGHSSKVLVHVGQRVAAGQPIALEGSTGHVTGPHLHFEVWTAMWHRISPGPFLAKQGIHLSRCQ
jgi:murein DD-endopeptidase MepM/ murein hydrolase activator NlpD